MDIIKNYYNLPSGDLYAPQGENVPVYIPKGWGVYNGAQTYAMQQSE